MKKINIIIILSILFFNSLNLNVIAKNQKESKNNNFKIILKGVNEIYDSYTTYSYKGEIFTVFFKNDNFTFFNNNGNLIASFNCPEILIDSYIEKSPRYAVYPDAGGLTNGLPSGINGFGTTPQVQNLSRDIAKEAQTNVTLIYGILVSLFNISIPYLLEKVYGVYIDAIIEQIALAYCNNGSTKLYYKQYSIWNSTCNILVARKMQYYSSSSYSSTRGNPVSGHKWEGGTPYDSWQPYQCRDLVVKYPY